MEFIELRREFWKEHFHECWQGPSAFDDCLLFKEDYKDKDVLEIGPGEGRQFKLVHSITKSYSIADICPEVLQLDLYKNLVNRFIINSYKENFGVKFNVIHFWYVFHHILPQEIDIFIEFLTRHSKLEGVLIFNFPDTGTDDKLDGTKTSHFRVETILEKISKSFKIVFDDKKLLNNHIIKAVKKRSI